jgi:hypothetical protein
MTGAKHIPTLFSACVFRCHDFATVVKGYVRMVGAITKNGESRMFAYRIANARDYQISKKGAQWFSEWGIDTRALRKSGRVFARQWMRPR